MDYGLENIARDARIKDVSETCHDGKADSKFPRFRNRLVCWWQVLYE
jgi:hypothetical protein